MTVGAADTGAPTKATTERVRVFGIRHHGPGSARSVRAALEEYVPQVVLIEGPADGDPLLTLAADPGLVPPVALLAYAADDPRVAAFWPFAAFSPEWQAIAWAAARGVPTRFCDLPASATLGGRRTATTPENADPAEDLTEEQAEGTAENPATRARHDPLALLASAAGYDDPERWWEDLVESRLDGGSPFDAITEAMAELRAHAPALGPAEEAREERREAHMRVVLRTALKEGHERVAVVCGAWHAPALTGRLPSAAADAKVLRGLEKRRATLTWIPWTHGRLATASGYGAGITSPGWYHHLFSAPDRPVTRWLTAVAGTLRGEDLPVSSAHVIEAVRLAETLATMRGRPLAGLDEVQEATRAVLCEGDDLMLDLVTRRLVVGEALGSVPDSAPTVPLEADLRASARRLRLKFDAAVTTLELDLRKPNDLDRSRLLHRLLLLGIDWGTPARAASRNLGTFREAWALQWRPELVIALVEASIWGTTVETAAGARIAETATGGTLAELTAAVERCLLADLPLALPELLTALDARAALDVDVAHLMSAVPPLVRAARYGDVRATDTGALLHVTGAILMRICAGLPAALTGLDADAAQAMVDGIDAVHAALATWGDEAVRARWLTTLAGLVDRDDLNGLLAGHLVRLLLDATRLDGEEAATRLARALSVGTPAGTKAAWVEGFLAGGGTLLVHDQALLVLLDDWVTALDEQAFTDVLPLLRRTFGTFTDPERRAMAARLRRPSGGPRAPGAVRDVDADRAAAAVATVALLLGLDPS
jgi:hypothetical protein